MSSQNQSRLYRQSTTSVHNYKRLHQFSLLSYVLLALIAGLGMWSILKVTGAFGTTVPDLADVGSIRDHFSAQLVTWLAVITLALYIFKEWRYGERGFVMVYFLAGLLALWLLPVVASEFEPPLVQLEMEFTLNICQPGGIEGDTVVDRSLCSIANPGDLNVMMGNAEPGRSSAVIRVPDVNLDNLSRWNVEGRGQFRVYFLLEQDSLAACEGSRFVTDRQSADGFTTECIERDGQVWSMHPFVTSENQTGRLVVYQERP